MIKVITAKEMGRIEALAYEAGASDVEFMEAAGKGVAEFIHHYIAAHELEWFVLLLVGKGNNGGDAYVAGRELVLRGYSVRALQLAPIEQCSQLCQKQYRAFREAGGDVIDVQTAEQFGFYPRGLILDGILGTGFHGEVSGLFAEAIRAANQSKLPIAAIDIPSGVNGTTGEVADPVIQADVTIFLGLPKTGFFVGPGWGSVGGLQRVEFGLRPQFTAEAKGDLLMMTAEHAHDLLPPLARSRHKYQAGYVVGLAGSALMPGAAILAGLAALRGGAGIVRMLYPASMERPDYPVEVLAQGCSSSQEALEVIERASACLIEPGLGATEEASRLAEGVLKGVKCPCVIDADALNLLAHSSGWALPKETILTPHVGEMLRLLGMEKEEQPVGLDWLSTCQLYACNQGVTLIVKGSPTYIFDPSGLEPPTVIPRGDPGMATAGCGDVLTGLLAALLSQGLPPLEAARLGAYVHALAGEAAAHDHTSYSMVASDVTEHLARAFDYLLHLPPAHEPR